MTDVWSPEARAALLHAADKRASYGLRVLEGPHGRQVALLGEAHLKLADASARGRAVIESVALRGVESFQSKQVTLGRTLRFLIYAPRWLLRFVTLGFVKDSSIIDAKQASHGYTVEIERAERMPIALHAASVYLTTFFAVSFGLLLLTPLALVVPVLVPVVAWLTSAMMVLQAHMLMLVPAILLRRWRYAWVLHPGVAILSARDILMANGIVRMLHDHPGAGPALVIAGRAHLPGLARELEKRGFRATELAR